MDTLKSRLAVNRLHPLFVAEVTGIDLTRQMQALGILAMALLLLDNRLPCRNQR